jgi:hypothetical protein
MRLVKLNQYLLNAHCYHFFGNYIQMKIGLVENMNVLCYVTVYICGYSGFTK